jgi:Protein of unknown function (DUF2490)
MSKFIQITGSGGILHLQLFHHKFKNMKINTLLLFALLFSSSLAAQKIVTEDEQLWFGVFNQTRFNQKWGLWVDAHIRFRDNFVNEPATGIFRAGPMYYITDDVRLTAAYAYVHFFPAPGHANIALPEHRPWQQIQWFMRGKNVRLTQAIRLEERFRRNLFNDDQLGEGYNFNWRVRYNVTLLAPLTKKRFEKGGLQAVVNNEVMINFGKNIVFNHFDQNRFFIGLAYPFNKHAQLHAGYMQLYQQFASGNQFRNQHTIRLFYFHNLDLR